MSLVPNQTFEVTIGGRSAKHYRELGYVWHGREPFKVPVEHLLDSSHQVVKYICDCCGKEFNDREYRNYITLHQKWGKDLCHKCASEQELMNKYGVKNPMQIPNAYNDFQNKLKEKYGDELQNKKIEWYNKAQQTVALRLKDRGVTSYFQLPEVKKKETKRF